MNRRQRFNLRRARIATFLAEQAEAWLHLDATRMSKRDAARWAACRDFTGLGECVIAWLHGDITQTPGHCGPPCDETIPLIPVLTACNRAGFVTDNSQLAETNGIDTWETWVDGFASDASLARLRTAITGTPLILAACRDRRHSQRHTIATGWQCPWRDAVDFWSERCPSVADDLAASWYVTITDPEDGRNDRLWPALAAFAGLVVAS